MGSELPSPPWQTPDGKATAELSGFLERLGIKNTSENNGTSIEITCQKRKIYVVALKNGEIAHDQIAVKLTGLKREGIVSLKKTPSRTPLPISSLPLEFLDTTSPKPSLPRLTMPPKPEPPPARPPERSRRFTRSPSTTSLLPPPDKWVSGGKATSELSAYLSSLGIKNTFSGEGTFIKVKCRNGVVHFIVLENKQPSQPVHDQIALQLLTWSGEGIENLEIAPSREQNMFMFLRSSDTSAVRGGP
jgi:hypothetical protein